MPEQTYVIRVELDDVQHLERLVGEDIQFPAASVEGLIEWLVHVTATGVRRPGSWERGVVVQMTGALL